MMATMTNAAANGPNAKLRRALLQLGAGMLVGLAVGAIAGATGVFEEVEDLDPFLVAALLVGVGLTVGGLVVTAASYRPRALSAMMLEGAGEGAATPRESAFYRLAGWVLVLAGVLAATPPVAVALLDPLTPPVGWVLLAVVTALALVQLVLNLRVWREADELTRRVTLEGACLAFFAIEGLLFLWAAAEVLGLAPAVSAWTVWTLMFMVYLVVAGWVAYRRGVG